MAYKMEEDNVGDSNDSTEYTNEPSFIETVLQVCSVILVILTFPFSLCACLRVVSEYERVVILRLGRIATREPRGPGVIFVYPCLDSVHTVDLRLLSFDVPSQEMLTKDAVTVSVDAVVYYRISVPLISVIHVRDIDRSTQLLAQTFLRNALGAHSLSEILVAREEIALTLRGGLDAATDAWGVKVERVEIKDVRLPLLLQRVMASEAEATREANALEIAAAGETRAATALRDAAMIIAQQHLSIHLRYLHTLSTIAAENNSTIVFPVPVELLRCMDLATV